MPKFIFLLLYMLGHNNKLIVSVVVDYKKVIGNPCAYRVPW
ncbi:hypothetical protein [Clostridium sp. BL8]|nr:hypothetical protein [Clostridium sp. BL8]